MIFELETFFDIIKKKIEAIYTENMCFYFIKVKSSCKKDICIN